MSVPESNKCREQSAYFIALSLPTQDERWWTNNLVNMEEDILEQNIQRLNAQFFS
jgi:hypothetical protein